MKKSFLKNLFKKRRFDWSSASYRKKSLDLLKDTDKFNIYQDPTQNKVVFQERFKKLHDK